MISRSTAEIAFAGVTALFGAVIAVGAREFGTGWSTSGPEPGAFPFYIGCIIIAGSLGNLIGALRTRATAGETFMSRDQAGTILRFVLPIIGFVIAALFLGLYVATAFYITGVMLFQGGYPVWHALSVGLGLPIGLYCLLEKGFQVALLKGPLEAALGL